jgi:phosphoribosyl 1,2-cyclic phosphodiesterase
MSDNVTKLGFWGVRGSTPTVDRANWRYGGNTPCLEIVTSNRTRIIFDCGTGLRGLGNRWLQTYPDMPMEAHIFVTHYHWDHIQGIPFFAPLYSEKNKFHFYSFRSKHLGSGSLQRVLEAQMATPYFPVDTSAMTAQRDFTEIAGGDTIQINDSKLTARWLNHPQGCLGFRLETPEGTLVYATDNEPGVPELDKSLRELATGADIFINDAQYSPEQLAGPKKGWGHSTWLEGVRVAEEAKVKNLLLFHHDPESSDKMVDAILAQARQKGGNVWAAAEGMIMTMGSPGAAVALPSTRTGQRRRTHFPAMIEGYGEDGAPFSEKTIIHDLSLQGAFLYMTHCPRLQSEVRVKMEANLGDADGTGLIWMKGYVVRREAGPQPNMTGVGLVFTSEIDIEAPDE